MTFWVNWYQKGRTIVDFNEARDEGIVAGELDHTIVAITFSVCLS